MKMVDILKTSSYSLFFMNFNVNLKRLLFSATFRKFYRLIFYQILSSNDLISASSSFFIYSTFCRFSFHSNFLLQSSKKTFCFLNQNLIIITTIISLHILFPGIPPNKAREQKVFLMVLLYNFDVIKG